MENKIRFSIGIPAYKGSHFVECVSSVLEQSYTNFELIIINDFSPDPIDEMVNRFDDSRIRYFKNDQNIGAEKLVLNWNKCVEKAVGEYFVLLGDDDTMARNYLFEFDKLIKRFPEPDVYHCRSVIIDENSHPLNLTPSWPEYESVYENIWHTIFAKRVQFVSDFMYRTDALKSNGGYYFLPMAWASDYVTSYIAAAAKGIAHTNKPLLNYRKHALTLSSSGSLDIKMEAILLQKKWFDAFLKVTPATTGDLLAYNDIATNIVKYFQKEKIYLMVSSFKSNFMGNCFKWFKVRSKYNISANEIIFAIIEYYKIYAAKKKYARQS